MATTTLPSSMRAAQWTSSSGGLEKNLKLSSTANLPKNAHSLPKDSTLVKVAYSACNPVDYKVAEMPLLGNFVFTKPATPCLDFSGTVAQTTLSHLKPGEPVFGKTELPLFGALGEYIVVGKEGIAPVPDGVSLKDAGGVGVAGLVAYQCIIPFVKSGDKVFINGGSGGTGTFGIQFAKAAGCYVTTACSGPNVELCKSLGADEVIDYRTENVADTLKRSGKQYDLIVDNVFVPDIYWQSPSYLKESGRYLTIAGDASLRVMKAIAAIFLIPSFLGGGQRKFQFVMCTANAGQYVQIAKWMAEGKVKTVIDQEYSLEDAGKAFQKLKMGGIRGKLVIKVSDD